MVNLTIYFLMLIFCLQILTCANGMILNAVMAFPRDSAFSVQNDFTTSKTAYPDIRVWNANIQSRKQIFYSCEKTWLSFLCMRNTCYVKRKIPGFLPPSYLPKKRNKHKAQNIWPCPQYWTYFSKVLSSFFQYLLSSYIWMNVYFLFIFLDVTTV